MIKTLRIIDLTANSIGGRTGKWLAAFNTQTYRYRVRQIEIIMEFFLNIISPKTNKEQLHLGARLRREIHELGDRPVQQTDFWKETCLALQRYSQTEDPLNFTNWPPLIRTIQTTSSSTIIASFLVLRRSPEWKNIWRPVLRHRRYGRPPAFLFYPLTNPITVQHAGHLHFFNKATGKSFFDVDCIVDLGAGYGSMCRLITKLGFNGRYLIFDQPPMLPVQRYFLALHGIDSDYEKGSSSVILFPRIENLIELLNKEKYGKVAVISTWALSEMPINLRNEIDPILSNGYCKNTLLAYQSNFTYGSGFEGIDNPGFFNSLLLRHNKDDEGWNWTKAEVPYHPGNYYLFGSR